MNKGIIFLFLGVAAFVGFLNSDSNEKKSVTNAAKAKADKEKQEADNAAAKAKEDKEKSEKRERILAKKKEEKTKLNGRLSKLEKDLEEANRRSNHNNKPRNLKPEEQTETETAG